MISLALFSIYIIKFLAGKNGAIGLTTSYNVYDWYM